MFNPGDRVQGFVYNNEGEEVLVSGTYMYTTNEPGEMTQDVVIRQDNGVPIHLDEQDARPVDIWAEAEKSLRDKQSSPFAVLADWFK